MDLPVLREILEAVSGITVFPREGSIAVLAHHLGMTPQNVRLWFEHRRMLLGVEAQEASEVDTDMQEYQVYQLVDTLINNHAYQQYYAAKLCAQMGG